MRNITYQNNNTFTLQFLVAVSFRWQKLKKWAKKNWICAVESYNERPSIEQQQRMSLVISEFIGSSSTSVSMEKKTTISNQLLATFSSEINKNRSKQVKKEFLLKIILAKRLCRMAAIKVFHSIFTTAMFKLTITILLNNLNSFKSF